jgi:hypothetical protein
MLKFGLLPEMITCAMQLIEQLGTMDANSIAVTTSVALFSGSRYEVTRNTISAPGYLIRDRHQPWNGHELSYPAVFESKDLTRTARRLVELEFS